MVTKNQKEQMTEFVAERLDGSGLYIIIKRNSSHILVAEKPEAREQPKTIDVLAHNYHRTVEELRDTLRYNISKGVGTAHIFYKDGETFMVRLGKRGNIKDPRSLKRYTKAQIDTMVHLRGLEKAVLDMSGRKLVYYQPATARLEESIRLYEMVGVVLDYSHIERGDPGYGFARDAVSKDYKEARQVEATTSSIELLVGAGGYVSIAPIAPKPIKPEQLKMF